MAQMSQGFPGGLDGKESVCNAGDLGSIPGSVRSPGERNGYHSCILAWRIPWTVEPGRSMWSQRVRYDWATNTSAFQTFPKIQETPALPVSLPHNPLSGKRWFLFICGSVGKTLNSVKKKEWYKLRKEHVWRVDDGWVWVRKEAQ